MKNRLLYILLLVCCLISCTTNDDVNYVPDKVSYSDDEIDTFFQQNFQDKYGCAVRWRWVDKFVDINYVVAPAFRNVLIPTGEMLKRFWIEPFILESKESGDFIRRNFPPEIVCVGSELRNADGTRTLGYADAGVRITLTELNYFDLKDRKWIIQQLHTIHHEFSHIVHQTYKMPAGFNEISEKNYTGEAWNDIYTQARMQLINGGVESPSNAQVDSVSQNMAIQRGMLTPYGTATEFEDFAEIVAIYLLTDPAEFNTTYLAEDPKRAFLNEGKAMIEKKVAMVKEYYMNNFSIDLSHLRSIILGRLNEIKTK